MFKSRTVGTLANVHAMSSIAFRPSIGGNFLILSQCKRRRRIQKSLEPEHIRHTVCRRLMKYTKVLAIAMGVLWTVGAGAQSTYQSSSDFAKYAMKLREQSILQLEPQVIVPTMSSQPGVRGLYPWKLNIVTTIFWVGESASQNNPVHNMSSSWDKEWHRSFGGYDNPDPGARRSLPDGGTIAAAFTPQGNPFYFALPYNDVERGKHKPEARSVVPWFKEVFEQEGRSVLRDRWIAIRKNFPNGTSRVCYAQWSDCGPFRTDHHQYVFGNELPRWNLNKGAGLDVSPGVRDYLGMASTDVVDWKFVEYRDVPYGPWSRFGDNNTFVMDARRNQTRVVQGEKPSPTPAPPSKKNEKTDLPLPKKDDDGDAPTVITK
jgi:hypothetical protein